MLHSGVGFLLIMTSFLHSSSGLNFCLFNILIERGVLHQQFSHKSLTCILLALVASWTSQWPGEACSEWPRLGHVPTSGAKGRVNYIQPTFLERERRLFLSKMSILFPEAGCWEGRNKGVCPMWGDFLYFTSAHLSVCSQLPGQLGAGPFSETAQACSCVGGRVLEGRAEWTHRIHCILLARARHMASPASGHGEMDFIS